MNGKASVYCRVYRSCREAKFNIMSIAKQLETAHTSTRKCKDQYSFQTMQLTETRLVLHHKDLNIGRIIYHKLKYDLSI